MEFYRNITINFRKVGNIHDNLYIYSVILAILILFILPLHSVFPTVVCRKGWYPMVIYVNN